MNAIGKSAPLPLNRILIVVGVIALTWAWWHVRPVGYREPVHAAPTLALWSLPLMFVPPVLSPDAVLYADLGWTLSKIFYDLGIVVGMGLGAYLFLSGAISLGTVYLIINYLAHMAGRTR